MILVSLHLFRLIVSIAKRKIGGKKKGKGTEKGRFLANILAYAARHVSVAAHDFG